MSSYRIVFRGESPDSMTGDDAELARVRDVVAAAVRALRDAGHRSLTASVQHGSGSFAVEAAPPPLPVAEIVSDPAGPVVTGADLGAAAGDLPGGEG